MKCGKCTLCCKLLDIPWYGSPVGKYCKFCDINNGCRIYDNVNSKCKSFNCAYAQMDKASINLRPDKCYVVFEKVSNRLMWGTADTDFKPNKNVQGQVEFFIKQGFSVILNSCDWKKPIVNLAKGHTNVMLNSDLKEFHIRRK